MRCGNIRKSLTAPVFTENFLCNDCKQKEEYHEDYKKACQINTEEFVRGNYLFKGIGKPSDLYLIF